MFEDFEVPVHEILNQKGIGKKVKLFAPPSPDLGDFCFVVNQIAGKNDPLELANNLQNDFEGIEGISSVTSYNAGNEKKQIIYLNFLIDDKFKINLQTKRIETVFKHVKDSSYGYLTINQGKSVMVEHTSANPISPIHVGNLRNSVQGDTFARILRHSGYDVHIHYYVNDVGLQVGFVVVGFELATKNLGLKPPIKIDLWTGQIYAMMNCFYTIYKLKISALERGVKVKKNYSINETEKKTMVKSLKSEIDRIEPEINKLTEIEKLGKNQKIQLKDLKIQLNKLNDEINDIEKYVTTYDDLKSRFSILFNGLYKEVSKIDLIDLVARYLKAYETDSDPKITELFRSVVTWVLSAFEWTLSRYNIKFDKFDYESHVTWSGLPTKIIDQLGKHENSVVDGEAVRYSYPSKSMKDFMKDAGLTKSDLAIRGQVPDLQLRRSDGTALYAAKDIAYSIMKFEDKNPEKIFNVISAEQSLPQFQMLLPLYSLGYTNYAANLHHYSYDNVELLGRVMSGRLAKYITADEFYDETYIRARIAKRQADAERNIGLPTKPEEWEEEARILEAVTLASTRFPLIEKVPRKRIELDLDRELDFRRNTGPFVQYAHARTNSLIERVHEEKGWAEIDEINFRYLAEFDIVEIFNHLDSLNDQIMLAVNERDPSKIAAWVFNLAQSFMKFYENYPVMKAENDDIGKARLQVVYAIRKGLQLGLGILGIPPASRL